MSEASEAHIELLLRLATSYYIDGESQAAIAAAEHLSRPTVSRLLARAREAGVVTISVQHPMRRVVELEHRLREEFRLDRVWVADGDSDQEPLAAVARHAARIIDELVGPGSVVSLSNGTTLQAVADELDSMRLRRRRDSTVVQMIGALGPHNILIDGPELCRRIAQSFGGAYRVMPVPLVVSTERIAMAMRREPSIATTLALAAHPDLAIVGIGSMKVAESGHIFDEWLSSEDAQRLVAEGAVGHIAGHHFDRNGHHMPTDLCRRTIGVPLERLREIPLSLGIAAGRGKAEAVLGALRGQFLNALVLDAGLAESVLATGGTDSEL